MREISCRQSSIPTLALGALSAVFMLGALLAPKTAEARPGTHPIVVSTWDSRASSVALEYQHGWFDGGGFNTASYHANFSGTSGVLSAQFGLYYVNFAEAAPLPTTQGMAGSATALFNLPVASRYENGLARTAVAFYVGSAPTALVSGERNYLTIPLVLGFGVPISPAKMLTFTPWFEFSPAVNLDTVIKPYSIGDADPADYIDADGNISADAVQRIVSDSVSLEASGTVGARAGLDLALHASDSIDFKVNTTIGSVGTAFSGTRVVYLGVGLVWRWDEIVPAVLPPEKRLLHESCDDVEARFRTCPNSRKWRTPEQVQKEFGATSIPPKTEPAPAVAPAANPAPAAPPPAATPAPAPAAPAPAPAAPGGGFPLN